VGVGRLRGEGEREVGKRSKKGVNMGGGASARVWSVRLRCEARVDGRETRRRAE
jgi:hypothetical protein